jgi:hypothetical protein
MSLAQWVSGRLVAQGIRGVAWLGRSLLWSQPERIAPSKSIAQPNGAADEEQGLSTAGVYANAVKEATK